MKKLLFLCFLASIQAIPWPEKRIVNGKQAVPFSSPHQVSLQYYFAEVDRWSHTCSGILLTDKTVLTAAQCVHERVESRMRVLVGAPHLFANFFEYGYWVSSFAIHENYDGTFPGLADDIAIITLNSTVTFNENVKIVVIAPENSSFVNTKCAISGWGLVSTSPPAGYIHLRTANVTEISTAECQSRWPGQMVTDEHVCAYEDSAPAGKRPSACMGDGGGPMMCGDNFTFLVGIASWGPSVCDGEKPSVYTRVTSYLPWISEQIQNSTVL